MRPAPHRRPRPRSRRVSRAAAARALGLAAVACLAAPPADAAGRRPYGGTLAIAVGPAPATRDPHLAATPAARWLAAWTHAGLFRQGPDGRPLPELARDAGRVEGRVLVLRLVDGARFHGGAPVTAEDVVASLARVAALGDRAPLAPLVAALGLEARGTDTVRLRAPAGVRPDRLPRLLARPELAVLEGGRPGEGRGAGPFRVARADDAGASLLAFEGHARGRPWLDGVAVTFAPDPQAERRAFGFGDVDAASRAGRRPDPRLDPGRAGLETVLAVPARRHRGPGARAFRAAAAALLRGAALGRSVDWPSTPADGPWPPALTPPGAPGPPAVPAAPRLQEVVVAYPSDDPDLAELARAVRDALAPLSVGAARALAVDGLRVAGAPDGAWDLALVRHPWAATDAAQAADELAWALGLDRPRPAQVLRGRVGDWARAALADLPVLPVLHLERPLWVRPPLHLPTGAAGPDAPSAWRR